MVDKNENGLVAQVFNKIAMPTNLSLYETSEDLQKAVLRAYFLGISDAKNDTLIATKQNEWHYETVHNNRADRQAD